MKRKIVKIDEALCNGCGLCATACHEGAIEMKDGKAILVSDIYCDGLGDCLPACPTGAIEIIEREADSYDQGAVDDRLAEMEQITKKEAPIKARAPLFQGCPGTMSKKLNKVSTSSTIAAETHAFPAQFKAPSQLQQWPVQLQLINPAAPWLKNADLLVAADCCAFSYGSFHQDFIQDKITMIGCPKLDDNSYYVDKLTAIFQTNLPKSITVVRMEVPCCSGIVSAVKQAMLNAQTIVAYKEVVISTEGEIIHP